tara:strand:+ start:3297 stop:3929 length:633 start_codon:yes stop_codon:yes gene_type:complete
MQVEVIESPTITNLLNIINDLSTRLQAAEEYIESQKADEAPYTPGSVVATTLHFDDIDLDSTDQEAFKTTLKETLAAAAGVDAESVILVDIAKTGSATVRVEIQYKDGADTSKKDSLITQLTSQIGLQDMLGSLGQVQTEELQDDLPIVSTAGKIFQLEKMIAREAVSLENSAELRLQNYRFLVVDDEVHVQRFDNQTNEYVGGTLVLDS